jgi:hypothetical protein
LRDEWRGAETSATQPCQGESRGSGEDPPRDPQRGQDEVPQAKGGGLPSDDLSFPASARHEEGEYDQVVLEELELSHRPGHDRKRGTPASQRAETRAAQACQVGEGDAGPEAGEKEASRFRGRRGGGENEGRSRFGAGHTRWSGQTTTPTT